MLAVQTLIVPSFPHCATAVFAVASRVQNKFKLLTYYPFMRGCYAIEALLELLQTGGSSSTRHAMEIVSGQWYDQTVVIKV